MRSLVIAASLFSLASVQATFRQHFLPEDPHTFPKYRVSFLNGLPVSNETAERWLKDGLRGGESEFLEEEWKADDTTSSSKEIESGDNANAQTPLQITHPAPEMPQYPYLEHMRLGPKDSYLCLVQEPLDHLPPPEDDEDPTPELTARSWSLLQPLTGTCLYHRQGWFTYSYCHNEEIRQFKELVQAVPHTPGGYIPEEDPDWEAYTLGKAPPIPEAGADLTVAEKNAIAANLELAKGAGSRYLVQRWGDGTVCDKTGRKREVEVQFHCSMTMTDTILFVKEAKTCSYVLVVNTPRLCGEPGFKSPHDVQDEAQIRCREIVHNIEEARVKQKSLPEMDFPIKNSQPSAEPERPRTPPARKADKSAGQQLNDIFRKALQAVMGGKQMDVQDPERLLQQLQADGKVVFEVVDEFEIEGDAAGDQAVDDLNDRLVEALRSAGIDVKGVKASVKTGTGDKDKSEEEAGDQ